VSMFADVGIDVSVGKRRIGRADVTVASRRLTRTACGLNETECASFSYWPGLANTTSCLGPDSPGRVVGCGNRKNTPDESSLVPMVCYI